jgi:predicted  nucleic acid-binding Zn-ribbon protein
MLNWRRDPDYERRMHALAIRMQQTENDILRVENEILQIEKETEQIERETEQLRRENARAKTLLSCVDQLCFPPESSSTPVTPTEPDCRPS